MFSQEKQASARDLGISYVDRTGTAYSYSREYVCTWGADSAQTILDNADSRVARYIADINANIRQIVDIGSSDMLKRVLNLDDTASGIAYVTDRGVFLPDTSQYAVDIVRTGYSDTGVSRIFSSDSGIVSQVKAEPYGLVLCKDGFSSETLVGEALPRELGSVYAADGAVVMRSASGGLWFQIVDGERRVVQQEGVEVFCHDVSVGGNVVDVAVGSRVVYEVVYGSTATCRLVNGTFIADGAQAESCTYSNTPVFVMQRQ